jgi:hypothetical protein
MNISPQYLAGVMDSDGSFSITKRHITRQNANYIAMIQITWTHTATSEDFMKELTRKYGGSYFIGVHSKGGTFKNSKPVIKYCAVGKAASLLTLDVKDFLILKKTQADNVIKLRELVTTKRIGRTRSPIISTQLEDIYLLNKQLNSKNKGEDDVSNS